MTPRVVRGAPSFPSRRRTRQKGSRLPRPSPAQPSPSVRALQDGGSAHRARPASHFMTKVDMSDYIFHLPIKPEERQNSRFMWQGKKYQRTAMPFSLTPAPRLATKILQPVIRYLRSMRVRLIVYIGDILVLARSQEEGLRHTQLRIDTLHHFGFGVHPDKIQAVPTRSIDFLRHPGQLCSDAAQSSPAQDPRPSSRDLPRSVTEREGRAHFPTLLLSDRKVQCCERGSAVSPTPHLTTPASPELRPSPQGRLGRPHVAES